VYLLPRHIAQHVSVIHLHKAEFGFTLGGLKG